MSIILDIMPTIMTNMSQRAYAQLQQQQIPRSFQGLAPYLNSQQQLQQQQQPSYPYPPYPQQLPQPHQQPNFGAQGFQFGGPPGTVFSQPTITPLDQEHIQQQQDQQRLQIDQQQEMQQLLYNQTYRLNSQPQQQQQSLFSAKKCKQSEISSYDNFGNIGDRIYSMVDGQTSPNGKWSDMFNGYGSTGTSTTGTNRDCHYFEQPKSSTTFLETHASLTRSTQAFGDFSMNIKMDTQQQLRQNNPGKAWEVGWIMWHWTDDFHQYSFLIKKSGIQLEKKDNNEQCSACEIYLITAPTPVVQFGHWYDISITVTGSSTLTPRIQITMDGVKLIDYVDNRVPNSHQLMSGYMTMYDEDALVWFDDVNITPY
jgi:hypothetical protein